METKKDLPIDIDARRVYSFLVLGSTRSGKSTMIDHILKNFCSNKISILMTESPNADAYKSETYRKGTIMCPGWHDSIIKDAYKLNKATNNHYMFNFILDDIVSAKHSKTLKSLLTVMRNSQIGCIISGQGATMLPPIARSNVNIILLGRVNNDFEAESIVKNFLTSFFPSGMTMVNKIKQYRELTKDHKFICLNNLNDEVFITKLDLK